MMTAPDGTVYKEFYGAGWQTDGLELHLGRIYFTVGCILEKDKVVNV
jgi:hypothetical protein